MANVHQHVQAGLNSVASLPVAILHWVLDALDTITVLLVDSVQNHVGRDFLILETASAATRTEKITEIITKSLRLNFHKNPKVSVQNL